MIAARTRFLRRRFAARCRRSATASTPSLERICHVYHRNPRPRPRGHPLAALLFRGAWRAIRFLRSWNFFAAWALALPLAGCSSGSNQCTANAAEAQGEFDAGYAAGFQAGEADDPHDAGTGMSDAGGPCPPAPMNRGPSTRDADGVCVFGQCSAQWGDCDGNIYGDCSTDLTQDPNCGACKTDCLSLGKKCAAVAPDIFGCI